MISRGTHSFLALGLVALAAAALPQCALAQDMQIDTPVVDAKSEEDVLSMWDARLDGWLEEAKTKGYPPAQLQSVQATIKAKGAAKREELVAQLTKLRIYPPGLRASNYKLMGESVMKAQVKWDAPATAPALPVPPAAPAVVPAAVIPAVLAPAAQPAVAQTTVPVIPAVPVPPAAPVPPAVPAVPAVPAATPPAAQSTPAAPAAPATTSAQAVLADPGVRSIVDDLRRDKDGISLRSAQAWKKLAGREGVGKAVKGIIPFLDKQYQPPVETMVGNPTERTEAANRMAAALTASGPRCEAFARSVAGEAAEQLAPTLTGTDPYCLIVSVPTEDPALNAGDLSRLHEVIADTFRTSPALANHCEVVTETPSGLTAQQEKQVRFATCHLAWTPDAKSSSAATLQFTIEVKKKGTFGSAQTRVICVDKPQAFRFHPYRVEWLTAQEDDALRRN